MKPLLRSRRWWFRGTAALLLVTAYLALGWYFSPPATAITRANSLKIKPGMTLAEVEAILGGPARHESGLADIESTGTSPSLMDSKGDFFFVRHSEIEYRHVLHRVWVSHAGRVVVAFDNQGRVSCYNCASLIRHRNPAHWHNRWLNWLDKWYNPPDPLKTTGTVM